MKKSRRIFYAASLSLISGFSWATVSAPDIGLLQEQNRIKSDSERKIQSDILDPILGKGNAVAFVDVEMEVKVESEESTRSGMGLAEKYREKTTGTKNAGLQTSYVMPGIPRPKTITAQGGPERPEAASAQQAQQIKGVQEERYSVKPVFKRLGVTVIHDENTLKEKTQIDLVRSRIVDAMSQYQLQADQVLFRPTQFNHVKKDWKDDVKKPEVYLPLLFAALLLLFLLWLFGPLWRFLSAYTRAIREKPAAEVNIESKEEAAEEGDGAGGENALDSQGKLDINFMRQPTPKAEDEEDDDMKKLEPFSYINDQNIKKLAYMFLLRKEEPWVVAIVASYLKPELAKLLLTALPVELQAKVAVEALTVRQITREQVMAINEDVKESVDFVVGGMERLLSMIEQSDINTRNNVLNYLKNEKPMVYDAVRKQLMLFEDVVGFPDRDMQIVIRELKTESMARALQGASPEIVNKFFTNMSTGAASLLKESMEYAQKMGTAQVEEERSKIVDIIKVLDKEGKIAVRDKSLAEGSLGLVEGMHEELSAMERRQTRFAEARRKMEAMTKGVSSGPQMPAPAPAPAADPVQAQSYFEAGANYYNAGQVEASMTYFETALRFNAGLWQARQYLGTILQQQGRTAEAVAHFEKVLEANPDPQLRTWLDSIKAQVGQG